MAPMTMERQRRQKNKFGTAFETARQGNAELCVNTGIIAQIDTAAWNTTHYLLSLKV